MAPATDSGFCAHHARRHSDSPPADDPIAADLLAGIDDFSSAASVNLFLGNLLEQLARKRLRRRDAVALAYISQLLLNSLAALHREQSRANDESDSPSFVITTDIPRPQREPLAVPAAPE